MHIDGSECWENSEDKLMDAYEASLANRPCQVDHESCYHAQITMIVHKVAYSTQLQNWV